MAQYWDPTHALRKVLYNACSVAVLSARMLCSSAQYAQRILCAVQRIFLSECNCVECDGYSIIELRAGYLDDWIDSINDNLCNYLRSQNTAPPHVRSMLEDIIEFTDYCPIGFDWGV